MMKDKNPPSMKRCLLMAVPAAMSVLLLCGCGTLGRRLDRPYDTAQRMEAMVSAGRPTALSHPFAEGLCVLTDSLPLGPEVSAEAAGVFSVSDGRVICAKNPFERLYPASVTKIMTALLAVKYRGENMDDLITVTEASVITESGATLAGIHPGDVLTLRQLLYGLMLPSGNDAGNAIAVYMSGDVPSFSEWMNQEALALGATGTHFVNPHGLTNPEHYTTAYDLYLIFNECLKYPEFREVIQTLSYDVQYQGADGSTVSKTWKNSNWYLTGEAAPPDGLSVIGGKTGTTKDAGYCLILASKDTAEQEYISVILKGESRPGLYENMTKIIGEIVE